MTATTTRPTTAVVIVIPARDEEERLGSCLDSIDFAVRHFRQTWPTPVQVSVVVVLDSCADDTADVVAEYPWAHALEVEFANVGAARAAGIRSALRSLESPGESPLASPLAPSLEQTWILNTDADSTVPPRWLVEAVRLADDGADLVLGAVRPLESELTPRQLVRWRERHPRGTSSGNVHGANLGVRASAYLAVGGFSRLPEHEDVDMVQALRASGAVVRNGGEAVTTSGRSVGRTPGGYAGYIAALDGEAS